MAEIWKAMRANLAGFPCIHLRSRTRQNVHGFRRFVKAGFQHLHIDRFLCGQHRRAYTHTIRSVVEDLLPLIPHALMVICSSLILSYTSLSTP